jgi:hypothetical protein
VTEPYFFFKLIFFYAAATAAHFGRDRALAQSLTLFLFLFYLQRLQPLALDVTEPYAHQAGGSRKIVHCELGRVCKPCSGVCVYVCVCIYVYYIYIYIHTYMCIIYIYIYTYIYIYIYTRCSGRRKRSVAPCM